MQTRELFRGNSFTSQEVKATIALYLKEHVGYDVEAEKVNFETIEADGFKIYLVILKDDVRRLSVATGGTGVLRQRQWSIFLFSIINAAVYEKAFGINSNRKEIVSPYNFKSFDEYYYDEKLSSSVKRPQDELYRSKRINYLLQNYIFSKVFYKNRYLFLNSYVYSAISIVGRRPDGVLECGFSTFYYNTNHVFKDVPSKNVINQSVSVNRTSYLVDNVTDELNVIEKNYNDMSDLVNAYKNALQMNSFTGANFSEIERDIQAGEHFIITEGMARTGKTVIAMRLLGLHKNSKFIIMNEYFYKSLKEIFKVEKEDFPVERIACHTEYDKAERFMSDSEILIVDEAQRLNRHEISVIISSNKNNINVFLGDNLQKLNRVQDVGIKAIEKEIDDSGLTYKKYYFSYSIGISNNVLYSIKYLLFDNIPFRNQSLNKYGIYLFDSKEKFLHKYKNDDTFRKHMATVYMGYCDYSVTIDGFDRWHRDNLRNYHYFLDKDIKDHVMLTTYELISRELDTIYVYVPGTVYADDSGLHYNIASSDEYMLNQLYILMTRAKGSINIYCENESAFAYLNARRNKLLNSEEPQRTLCPEDMEKSKKLEEQINDRGITRLIHFTSADNLESIRAKGIMSVAELKNSGTKYDYNDEGRYDCVEDGISLSVQNPNHYLLNSYKKRYTDKKYVCLILDPALLYEITDDSGERLAPRIYCDYNAASGLTKRSEDDFGIMFGELFNGGCWVNTRKIRKEDEPTTVQAEILFRHTIDPKYILEESEV